MKRNEWTFSYSINEVYKSLLKQRKRHEAKLEQWKAVLASNPKDEQAPVHIAKLTHEVAQCKQWIDILCGQAAHDFVDLDSEDILFFGLDK